MDDWNRKADHSNPRMDKQDSPEKQRETRLGMGSVAALRNSPGLTNRSRRKCARLAGVFSVFSSSTTQLVHYFLFISNT